MAHWDPGVKRTSLESSHRGLLFETFTPRTVHASSAAFDTNCCHFGFSEVTCVNIVSERCVSEAKTTHRFCVHFPPSGRFKLSLYHLLFGLSFDHFSISCAQWDADEPVVGEFDGRIRDIRIALVRRKCSIESRTLVRKSSFKLILEVEDSSVLGKVSPLEAYLPGFCEDRHRSLCPCEPLASSIFKIQWGGMINTRYIPELGYCHERHSARRDGCRRSASRSQKGQRVQHKASRTRDCDTSGKRRGGRRRHLLLKACAVRDT